MSKSGSNARRLRRASERVRASLALAMSLAGSFPEGAAPRTGSREAWLVWAGRTLQLLRAMGGIHLIVAGVPVRDMTGDEEALMDALQDLEAHVGPLDDLAFHLAWEEACVAMVMEA